MPKNKLSPEHRVSVTKRKIIQVGDSLAVTLPRDWLERVGLKKGDEVALVYDKVVKIVVVDERV